MKKINCLALLLCLSIQLSKAQTAPLKIYSAYRYLLSDMQKSKSGFPEFKFHNRYIKLKSEVSFSVYNDRIVYKNGKSIIYKIYKTKAYSDDIHYYAKDVDGQYYDIVIKDIDVDKKHYYTVDLFKTDKNNNYLSLTRFDLHKVK